MPFGIKVKKPWAYIPITEKIRVDREKIEQIGTAVRPFLEKGDYESIAQARKKVRQIGGMQDEIRHTSTHQVRKTTGDFLKGTSHFGQRQLDDISDKFRPRHAPLSREDWEKNEVLRKVSKDKTYEEYLDRKKKRDDMKGGRYGRGAHAANVMTSGEAAYKEISGSEGFGELGKQVERLPGPLQKPAYFGLDVALAPATIVQAPITGLGVAGTRAGAGKLIQSVATQFAKETGTGVVGYYGMEYGAKGATHVPVAGENKYFVGGVGLAAGITAGGVAYNPKGAARLSKTGAQAIGNRVKQMGYEAAMEQAPVMGMAEFRTGSDPLATPKSYIPETIAKREPDPVHTDMINALKSRYNKKHVEWTLDPESPNYRGVYNLDTTEKLATLASINPMVNERHWFHSTGIERSGDNFTLLDPVHGTKATTQGPGIYSAADPRFTEQYGKRGFMFEFDGTFIDLTKPAYRDSDLTGTGISWDNIRLETKRRLEAEGLDTSRLDDVFSHSNLQHTKSNTPSAAYDIGGYQGTPLGNSYVYRDALWTAIERSTKEFVPTGRSNINMSAGTAAERLAGKFGQQGYTIISPERFSKYVLANVMSDMGVDATYHFSMVEKDVLIVLNGEKARIIKDVPSNKNMHDVMLGNKRLPKGSTTYALTGEAPTKGEMARMALGGQGATITQAVGGAATGAFAAQQEGEDPIMGAIYGAMTGVARSKGVKFGMRQNQIMSMAARTKTQYPTKPPPQPTPEELLVMANQPDYITVPRDLNDIAAEVDTTNNKLVKMLIGKTGINPSVMETDIGKQLIAYIRQKINVESMTETALAAALDKYEPGYGRHGVGLRGAVFELDQNGISKQHGAHWTDIFHDPKAYDLTTAQQNYIRDYNQLFDEMDFLLAFQDKKITRNPDGSLWVPRKVKTVNGVEITKPTGALLQDVYETALEGIENGIQYENNPRLVAELYMKNYYHSIVKSQLDAAIDPYTVKVADLIPEDIRNGFIEARDGLAMAKANLGVKRNALEALKTRMKVFPELSPQQKGSITLARNRVKDAAKEVNTRTDQLRIAKAKHTKAYAQAQEAQVGNGKLFGRADKDIPIRQWAGKFVAKEDYDKLVQYVGHYGGIAPAQPNPIAKAVEFTGNVVRTAASVGDLAMPFVHGLPLLARRPDAWAKMAFKHYQAFADPSVRGKYIANNLDVIKEMARNGIPIGDNEFYAGVSDIGNMVNRGVAKAPILSAPVEAGRTAFRQTVGRFQQAYSTGLLVERVEIYKALRPGWKGTDAELSQYIRNLSGGIDTRALGAGPNQRALESVWLAFSPKLLRSTIALVADARNVGRTATGTESARTLFQLAAGATAGYYAVGVAMGKSDEEIRHGLNPLNGKEFLSYNINGDYVGIGGQIRAIVQLGANLYAHPTKVFTTTDQQDNPLIAFYMQRGAPAINIVGSTLEATTGADVIRYEDIDSPVDLVKHIGTSAMPFAIQNIIEGQNVGAVVAGFLGARTSTETPKDKLDQYTETITNGQVKNFYDLPESMQAEVRAQQPELWKSVTKSFSPERQKYYSEKERYATEQAASDQQLLTGELSRDEWIQQYEDRNLKLIGAGEALFEGDPKGKKTPADEYYKKIDESRDAAGAPDWDMVQAWVASLPADQQEYINKNTGVGGTAVVQSYRAALRKRHEYFQLPKYKGYNADEARQIDEFWQTVRNNSKSAETLPMLRSLTANKQGVDENVVKGVRKRILRTMIQTKDREKYAKANPELDLWFGKGKLTKAEIASIGG